MRLVLSILIFCLSLSATAQDKTLLVLGDSISAGYGISLEQSWVYLLKKRLQDSGYRYKVKNASISGDTTRGARERLSKIIAEEKPDISIIELGGNDGLRGLSLTEMSANLDVVINELAKTGSHVLLVPMRLPPNYGPYYNDRFEAVYTDVATRHAVTLSKFILQGIAEHADLMQSDGIHPRAQAQPLMLDNVWESLLPLLVKY
jgi:acyl-CoA thioesterase-1